VPTSAPPAAQAASTQAAAVASQPPAVKPVETAQPIARKPVDAGPMARPVARPGVERRAPKPGELICGNCGAGNEPTRRFCRACGTSLAEAKPAPPLPWYRRIFTRREKQPLAAGERTKGTTRSAEGRPSGIRPGVVITRVLAGVVLLGVVGYAIVPTVRQGANALIANVTEEVRKRVNPRYALLDEKSVTATSGDTGHEAGLAFDGAVNTYWSTSEPQPTVRVELPAKVDVGAIVLRAGVVGQPNAFRTPATIEITSVDTRAKVQIEVKAGLDRQDHLFDLPETSAIEIRVTSSRGGDSLPLAISEIEVNARE
jgi:hypothetical protein